MIVCYCIFFGQHPTHAHRTLHTKKKKQLHHEQELLIAVIHYLFKCAFKSIPADVICFFFQARKNRKLAQQSSPVSIKKFVATACKRPNPAEWLGLVERECAMMRKRLKIVHPTQSATAPVVTPPTSLNFPMPSWLEEIKKTNRVRGVSRKGKEYSRIRRHPNELCKISIDLMVIFILTRNLLAGTTHPLFILIILVLTR